MKDGWSERGSGGVISSVSEVKMVKWLPPTENMSVPLSRLSLYHRSGWRCDGFAVLFPPLQIDPILQIIEAKLGGASAVGFKPELCSKENKQLCRMLISWLVSYTITY